MTIAPLLIADDDSDDCRLIVSALKQFRWHAPCDRVHDGEELMEYLLRQGPYRELAGAPLPALILLDLNMPKKDGREALREIKAHPELRSIPVVALTQSSDEEDIARGYALGLNAFVRKPATLEQFTELIKTLKRFWLDSAQLPSKHSGGES